MKNELIKIGLTEYEAKVYETLLLEGDITGGKISKLSKVPHGKVYNVLLSLIEKGFVSVTPLKPKIFRAKEPNVAIKAFLDQKINVLKELKQDIPKKVKKFSPLKTKELSEQINLLGSKKSTYSTIYEMAINTKKELKHVFTFEQGFEQYLDVLKQLISREVKVKIIASLLNKETKKIIKRYIKNEINVRYYPLGEIRFLIKDEDECLINFLDPNDKRKRLAIYFSHSGFSRHMSDYFDELWKKAKKAV